MVGKNYTCGNATPLGCVQVLEARRRKRHCPNSVISKKTPFSLVLWTPPCFY